MSTIAIAILHADKVMYILTYRPDEITSEQRYLALVTLSNFHAPRPTTTIITTPTRIKEVLHRAQKYGLHPCVVEGQCLAFSPPTPTKLPDLCNDPDCITPMPHESSAECVIMEHQPNDEPDETICTSPNCPHKGTEHTFRDCLEDSF